MTLFLIGLSDASQTFRDDITHGHVRIGHGMVIIGLFSILGALPHLIEGLEAGGRFLDLRAEGSGQRRSGQAMSQESRLEWNQPGEFSE